MIHLSFTLDTKLVLTYKFHINSFTDRFTRSAVEIQRTIPLSPLENWREELDDNYPEGRVRA